MSKIAVIKTGGKQYKVKEEEIVMIEKLDAEINANVKFETLLVATADGSEVNLGKPSLGEKVEATVVEHGKNDKVSVKKYKNKTRYLRNKGHRQNYTKVKISKIE